MAVKFYYGLTANPTVQVPEPAPLATITFNPYYAGDNIIGYDYTITLKGYAIANFGSPTAPISEQRVIQKVKQMLYDTFDKNGAVLLAKDDTGQDLFRAVGSKIVSISVESNDNQWVNYANYTIELTFNDIIFYACDARTLACPEIVIQNYPKEGLVNIEKYKIRSFTDSWTFTVDGKNYNAIGNMVRNEHFNITYRIEAQGANHFVGPNFDRLIPAWEQAKKFCQDRLFKQVGKMMLELHQRSTGSSDDGVSPAATADMANMFVEHGLDGIYNMTDAHYNIYNETLNVFASEANGSFTLEYGAIVKRYKTGSVPGLPPDLHVIHTVTPNKTVTDAGSPTKKNVSLSISGKIQGLVKRNLLSSSNLKLQSSTEESLLEPSNLSYKTRYHSAKEYFKIICPDNKNLTKEYKNYFGITYALFGVPCSETSGPAASSFSVNHNFNEGTIDYSVSFDGARVCSGSSSYYTNVDLVLEDKIDEVAEIVIPGRVKPGALVQKLNTFKPRTVTINITGRANKDCCANLNLYGNGVCQPTSSFYPVTKNANDFTMDGILPPRDIGNGALTEDTLNLNPMDGTFSATRKYIYFDVDATT